MTDRAAYVAEALGAYEIAENKRFAIYIPDQDKAGNDIDASYWIDRAIDFFRDIEVGATAMPAALGVWKGRREHSVVVYSHMNDEIFDRNKYDIRRFVHEFGREASQDTVMCEFGSLAIFINAYDRP